MRRFAKMSLFIGSFLLPVFVFAQTNVETIKVTVNQRVLGYGDSIISTAYIVSKDRYGKRLREEVDAGCLFFITPKNPKNIVSLHLSKNKNTPIVQDLYVHPNLNPKHYQLNEFIVVLTVNDSYWQECEQGVATCNILTLVRTDRSDRCFLVLPYGRAKKITMQLLNKRFLNKENVQKEQTYDFSSGPPVIDLTGFRDGSYTINTISEKINGSLEFEIKTQ